MSHALMHVFQGLQSTIAGASMSRIVGSAHFWVLCGRIVYQGPVAEPEHIFAAAL